MEYQKITKVYKTSRVNNSKTVSNGNDQEMTEERYMYLEIDNLR